MKPPFTVQASFHRYADEQIDVLRIRLWNGRQASAVLSDLHGAERVLANWALDSGCGAVRFEVTFVDAYVLEGCHEFFRKGKRKCTFATHLRRMMKGVAEMDGASLLPSTRDASHYAIPAC